MSRRDGLPPFRPRLLKALTVLTGCRPGTAKKSVIAIADAMGYGDPIQIAMRGVVYRTVTEHPDLVELGQHLDKWYAKGDDEGGS